MAWAYERIDTWLAFNGFTIREPKRGQGKRDCHTRSFHCFGQGRDYGLTDYGAQGLDHIAIMLEPFAQDTDERGHILPELFWRNPGTGEGWFYRKGARFTPSKRLDDQHRNHVHVAILSSGSFPKEETPDMSHLRVIHPEGGNAQWVTDGVFKWPLPNPEVGAEMRALFEIPKPKRVTKPLAQSLIDTRKIAQK